KALDLLNQWRHEFPDEFGPLRYLVEMDMKLGHYELALSQCDTMETIRPGSSAAPRGFLMSFLGRMQDAEEQFKKLLGPDGSARTAPIGRIYLAMLAYQRHQYARGLDLIRDDMGENSKTYDLWVAGCLAAANGDSGWASSLAQTIGRSF